MVQVVEQDAAKHAVRMLEELHRMKQDKDHCDFIVQVGDDVYHTHKNIMSAGSDYFRAMLKYDTIESHEGRVVLKDVDSESVKICIDFMYSGKFQIPDEKMIELLHVAIMMQLEDIKQAISDILEKSITVESYFSTRNVGDIYGLFIVSSRCRMFLENNIIELANHAGFGSVEKTDLYSVLDSSVTNLWEEEKLELSLKWIEGWVNNKQYLHEILEIIQLDRISPVHLQQLVETHPILRNDSMSYELISKHLLEDSVESVNRKELIILFDGYSDCIRAFNPISEKITMFHNAKCRHLIWFRAILHDLDIYILRGNKSVYRLNFREKHSNWQKMDDMICEHGRFPCSVSSRGSIFVIGGSVGSDTNVVETFVPSVNRWFQLQNKPTTIGDASLVSINDSIYCIGGNRNHVPVSSFCRFTPASSEWVALEPMRSPVYDCGVVAVDQKIFVLGGWNGEKKAISDVECYDVTSAQWSSLPSMNFDHGFNMAYHIGNWIYVVDEIGDSQDIEKYDLLNKKWDIMKKEPNHLFEVCGSAMVEV